MIFQKNENTFIILKVNKRIKEKCHHFVWNLIRNEKAGRAPWHHSRLGRTENHLRQLIGIIKTLGNQKTLFQICKFIKKQTIFTYTYTYVVGRLFYGYFYVYILNKYIVFYASRNINSSKGSSHWH